MRLKYLRYAATALLVCVAAVQLFYGFHPRANFASDFQWGGARMLAHNVDPWAAELDGTQSVDFSPPNYLHELYLVLLPLTWFSFPVAAVIWQVVNLCLSIAIVLSLCRIFDLSRSLGAILLLLLWAGNPFRITLGLGQLSLLELYLFCSFFELQAMPSKALVLGLSYAKYSFSPVLVLYLAFQRCFKLLAISLALPLLGLLVAWFLVGGNLLHLAVEPLLVSRSHVCSGFADIMEVSDRLISANQPQTACAETVSPVSYCLSLTVSVFYAFWLYKRRLNRGATMALLAIATLLFFRHLVYDSVFLLVPLAYVCKNAARTVQVAMGTTIFLFWYAYRFVGLVRAPRQPLPLLLLNVSLLVICAVLIDRYAEKSVALQ
jgi:hypothetical protein